MTDTSLPTRSAGRLRAEMVERIVTNRDTIGLRPLSQRVLDAMRTVPRDEFLPEAALEDAYADRTVVIKRLAEGEALSCASVPGVVAVMLTQLDVAPGDHILEVGAGTGYNAALLAELAGPTGQVTTIDIDPEVTAHARRALDATGYGHVRVIIAPGQAGCPDHAPYQRVIATVGPWDLPAPWRAQLAENGRMVVPLRWRGQSRAVAFVQHPDRLESDDEEVCGFVPMLGEGQDGEREARIGPDGVLTLTWDADQDIVPERLAAAFDQAERTQAWSGAWLGPMQSMDGIWLRISATEPGACRIVAGQGAVDAGLRPTAMSPLTSALVEGNSLAYMTLRAGTEDERRWELGAWGYGPAGHELAVRICDHVRIWSAERTRKPTITAYPANTPDDRVGPAVIDKPHTRLTVRY